MKKRYHKRTQRNGNVEARKLLSNAITALPPTDVDLLLRKPMILFSRTQTEIAITYVNPNTVTATKMKNTET
jgi:hypothetical protein